MRNESKKIVSIIIIVLLLPYILTVFIKGEGVSAVQSTMVNAQVQVNVDGEVNTVIWEEYLIGILAKEIPIKYSLEAIKAQAVIIRTRLARESVDETGIYQEDYYTVEEIQKKWTGNESVEMYNLLSEAIQETEDVKLYYDGELAATPYHVKNSGTTRNGNEVFLSEDYPYLISVSCPLDLVSEEEVTMVTISYTELTELLGLSEVVSCTYEDILITSIDEAGYVLTVEIQGNIISGETFRTELALKSSAFALEEAEEGIVITTLGNGHGLGLSQNTAHYMGLEGKTYEEILQYFYPGTELKK